MWDSTRFLKPAWSGIPTEHNSMQWKYTDTTREYIQKIQTRTVSEHYIKPHSVDCAYIVENNTDKLRP